MNAERSDDLASDSGRTTPGQRATTRRTGSRKSATTTAGASGSATGDATATSASVAAVSTAPVSPEPPAEPTRTMPASVSLPSTPTDLAVVATPADPPTTELRGPIPGTERPISPPAAPPAPAPVPTNIYRARRPGVAILLIIPAVAVGVLLVQALVNAVLADPIALAGVIASVCALVSLPFLVAGVYGLVSGAAHGAEHYGFKVWARPPLAYLLVGLALVTAAALAVG